MKDNIGVCKTVNFIGYGFFALYLYFRWTFDVIEFPLKIGLFSFGALFLVGWYLDRKLNSRELFLKLAFPIIACLFCIPHHINFLLSTEYDGSYLVTGKTESSSTRASFFTLRYELQLENGKSIWVQKGSSNEVDLKNLKLRKVIFGIYFAV